MQLESRRIKKSNIEVIHLIKDFHPWKELTCASFIINIIGICTHFTLKITNDSIIISVLYMRKLRHNIDCLTNLIEVMPNIS